jgi:hypothetical protein
MSRIGQLDLKLGNGSLMRQTATSLEQEGNSLKCLSLKDSEICFAHWLGQLVAREIRRIDENG